MSEPILHNPIAQISDSKLTGRMDFPQIGAVNLATEDLDDLETEEGDLLIPE